MPSLVEDQRNMQRHHNLDKSIKAARKHLSLRSPRSYDELLDRLYKHNKINARTMRRLRGGPDAADWNDGNQFFLATPTGKLYDKHGRLLNRVARGTKTRKHRKGHLGKVSRRGLSELGHTKKRSKLRKKSKKRRKSR